MQLDRGSDVLRSFKAIFRIAIRILKPCDVEIVAARGNFLTSETAETAGLSFVFPFRSTQWIITKGAEEPLKIGSLERIGLALGRRVGAHVVNPHCLGRVFGRSLFIGAGEEKDIGLHTRRVKNAGRQSQDSV